MYTYVSAQWTCMQNTNIKLTTAQTHYHTNTDSAGFCSVTLSGTLETIRTAHN